MARHHRFLSTLFSVLLLTSMSPASSAVGQRRRPAASQSDLPPPRDEAYVGTIDLEVDASDVARGSFRVRERIPVRSPGSLILLYPEWIPGNHAPRGPIAMLAGLQIVANGATLPWRRDPRRVHAFHVEVPRDTAFLDVSFQYLSPTAPDQGRVVATRELLDLQWNTVVLYPAGHLASRIRVRPRVRLPNGWGHGTALEVSESAGEEVRFRETDLARLIDSPLIAGRYFRRVELPTSANVPVHLNVVADRADQLQMSEAQIQTHIRLVEQADRIFDGHPFAHYDFLLGLTTRSTTMGLEHLESSEVVVPPTYFTDWDTSATDRDLVAHELFHAWNGKVVRPEGIVVETYQVPSDNELLWVYEGLTQYYGYVLAARSGMWTFEQALADFALTSSTLTWRMGREWRPLQDTVHDPIYTARRPQPWRSWQRNEDYYPEGVLFWLEVDTLIREHTGGARSLDDVVREMYRSRTGRAQVFQYRFDDVVAVLSRVDRFGWGPFLRQRLDATHAPPPLEGLTRAGYRLDFSTTRSAYEIAYERLSKTTEFLFSLGIQFGENGNVAQVVWDSPAFQSGLTAGSQVLAVDGESFSTDTLARAITAAAGSAAPIELIVKSGDQYRVVAIDYHGGLRFPILVRDETHADMLTAILAPR